MSVIDLTNLPADSLICMEQMGNCRVCGKYDDLRYGVCFHCGDLVKSDGEEAWDVRNPSNRWSVRPH